MPIIPIESLKGLNTKAGLLNEMLRLGYENEDENQVQLWDPEELYSMGYSKKQIQFLNDKIMQHGEEGKKYINYEPPARIPYALLREIRLQNRPLQTDIGFDEFGNSKYDKKVKSISDLDDINEFRALEQSGFELAVHGLSKGVAIAAGTFIDGMIGSWAGLFNIASEAAEGNIHTIRDIGKAFVQNPISKTISDLERQMEDYLPNYRTLYEQENPWRNLFSANAIFDGFLKNAGYFVGAALAGRMNAKALGSIIGALKSRDIIAGLAAKSGNTAEEVLKGANYAARGKQVQQGLKNVDMIADELEKVGKQIRNQKRVMGAAGLFTETFSESRMEALNGIDQIYTPEFQKAELARRDAMNNTLQYMMEDDEDNPLSAKWFDLVPMQDYNGNVTYQKVLNQLGEQEYKRRLNSVEDSYNAAVDNLSMEAAGAANRLFLANVVALSLTNWLQMGKWYTGGFEANSWAGRKIVKDIIGSSGAKTAVRNKAITRGMVAQTALDNVIEGFEEGIQGVLQKSEGIYSGGRISKKMQELALDHNFAQLLDYDTNNEIVNLITAFGKGFNAYVGDPNNFQEMLYGFLTPLLLPGKVKAGKRKDGSTRYIPIPGGGIQQRVNDIKLYNKMADDLANYINTNRDRYEGLAKGAALALEYEKIQKYAMEIGDQEMYNSAKHAEIITAAAMYYKAGMLEDYKSRLGALTKRENFTDDYIQQIRDITKISENEKSDDELVDDIIKSTTQALEDINQYEKIFKGLNTAYGTDTLFTSEVMSEIAWNAARAEKLERNMFGFARRAVEEINELVDEANEHRTEDKKIPHVKPLEVLRAEVGENDEIDESTARGYNFDKFAEQINSNEDLLKIAQSSIAYRLFINAHKRRADYLNTFKTLYTNPELYTDMFMKKQKEIMDEIYDSFISDVSADMSEITSIQELKKAVNLSELSLEAGIGALNRLMERTQDELKKKWIELYKKGFKKYNDILNALLAVKQTEQAINPDSIYIPQLDLMIDDLKDIYKLDDIVTEEDLNKWIESKADENKIQINLANEDGSIKQQYESLDKELNDVLQFEAKTDDHILLIEKTKKDDPSDLHYSIVYKGDKLDSEDLGNENVAALIPEIIRLINTKKVDSNNWKGVQNALKKNESELLRTRLNSNFLSKDSSQAESPIHQEVPEWAEKLTTSELNIIKDIDVDNPNLPKSILEKLELFGFDTSNKQDLLILKDWAKDLLNKENNTSTDGNSPEDTDNVQNGNPVQNQQKTDKSVFHGWKYTEFSIEQAKNEKQNSSWARELKIIDYINWFRQLGAYDFVNQGKLADLIDKSEGEYGLTMIYVKSNDVEELQRLVLLAVESNDGKLEVQVTENGTVQVKRYQVVGHLNPLSQEEQKSGSEKGNARDSKFTQQQKELSATKFNGLISKIEESARDDTKYTGQYFVYEGEKAYIQKERLYSGRITIKEDRESIDGVLTKENINDTAFAIMINGQPVFGFKKLDNYILPNQYSQTSRDGAVIMFAKAADGRYYPKAIRIKQFEESDINDKKNSQAQHLKRQLDILFDKDASRFKRASAKARIKRIIHFPDSTSSAEKKYDIHFDGETVRITDLNTHSDVISTSNIDEFISKLSGLGLRYQVSLADITSKQRILLFAEEGILRSNLASVYNVNGSFDILIDDVHEPKKKSYEPKKPKDTPPSDKPKPDTSISGKETIVVNVDTDTNQFNTSSLDTSLVDFEITLKEDEHNNEPTLKIYIKDKHDIGHFELVKDVEDGFFSVHFKTGNADTGEIYGSTKEERAILFDQLIKAIPEGACVSTWGSVSEKGIRGLDRVGKDMDRVGERPVKDREGNEIFAPIYLKKVTTGIRILYEWEDSGNGIRRINQVASVTIDGETYQIRGGSLRIVSKDKEKQIKEASKKINEKYGNILSVLNSIIQDPINTETKPIQLKGKTIGYFKFDDGLWVFEKDNSEKPNHQSTNKTVKESDDTAKECSAAGRGGGKLTDKQRSEYSKMMMNDLEYNGSTSPKTELQKIQNGNLAANDLGIGEI